jgi:hypothetical protein
MSKGWTTALLSGLALTVATAGAHAFERCEPFSVYSDHAAQKHAFIDHGAEGPSVGDRRITYTPLRNAAGDIVGDLDSEVTAMHPDADGNLRTSRDVILQFPDGVILYKILPHRPLHAINDLSGPIAQPDATRLITGGSGVFDGARGTVSLVRDDTSTEFIINVSCE